MIESGKDFILSLDAKKVNKAYEITVSKDKPFFKRYIRTCYVLGYDSITIVAENTLPLKLIKEILSNLIGYEIIEQTTKRCVISVVASPYDENFDAILKRIFFMLESMVDEIISVFDSKDYESLQEIAAMEGSINTFVDFCLRILNKKGYVDFRKTPYLYQILAQLEQIGDGLRDLATHLSPRSAKIKDVVTNYREYFIHLRQLFYKYDMKKIKVIKNIRLNLYDQVRKAVHTYPEEMLDLYMLVSILHQFEIALDPINN